MGGAGNFYDLCADGVRVEGEEILCASREELSRELADAGAGVEAL